MSGRLGAAAPAADVATTVYTVPAGKVATVNINVVNRGEESATVRIALATQAAPANADWVEYDAEVPVAGVLQRTADVLSGGERVIVQASSADLTVRVSGFTQEA